MRSGSNNLLVVHGGGPTAVLNCSLYGIISECENHAVIGDVLGARYGISGALSEDLIDLHRLPAGQLEALKRSPGSAIGSSRRKIEPEEFFDQNGNGVTSEFIDYLSPLLGPDLPEYVSFV
ncbi:MAG: hypothetical protein KGZ25_15995 [Planctomycetes bacterium]|nr:hypothetical protein [Planctomycetota bacterium]